MYDPEKRIDGCKRYLANSYPEIYFVLMLKSSLTNKDTREISEMVKKEYERRVKKNMEKKT